MAIFHRLLFIPRVRGFLSRKFAISFRDIRVLVLHLLFYLASLLTILCSCLLTYLLTSAVCFISLHCLWHVDSFHGVYARFLVGVLTHSYEGLPFPKAEELRFHVAFFRRPFCTQRTRIRDQKLKDPSQIVPKG